MSRIFWYELKMLIFNRLFLSLLIITGLYSYMVLSREIILGIAFTAPYSPWSYSAYLANILPLLMITLLFFITFMHSNHEKQVMHLTFVTPVDRFKFCLVKCMGIAAGFLIISLFVIIISMIFYVVLFRFTNFGDFIIPVVITLIPCLLFIIGSGLLLGCIHANILYVLMIVVLSLRFLPLPPFFDLYGSNVFTTYPMSLSLGPDGEPPFLLPIAFIIGRIFFSVVGILMVLLGIKRYKSYLITNG
ncbi:MAG: hypothetical protein FWG89_10100 [Treponema sp.]|nr:hypothetical protein [Treponema sp.]